MTIKEMAQKAGVSVATISRAMEAHTRSKVAPQTLKRVDALIKQYGYTTNLAAKHLRQTLTRTIGIVFPYVPGIFYSEYYTHILAGATEYLLETDYRFKMLLLKEGAWWDDYNFRVGEGVDGLIIIHWFKIFSNQAALEKINIPYVLINDLDLQIKAQFVAADQVLGGRMAAQYLYSNGHRQMAVLTGPAWSVDSQLRLEGFKDFLKEKGIILDSELVEDAGYLEQQAYEHTANLLHKNKGITAIFCCNDQMAFGALRRIKESGLECPKDISLVGFDDEAMAAMSMPPLTTIRVDVSSLAREAAKVLLVSLKAIDNNQFTQIVSPPTLIERQSVKKIN